MLSYRNLPLCTYKDIPPIPPIYPASECIGPQPCRGRSGGGRGQVVGGDKQAAGKAKADAD